MHTCKRNNNDNNNCWNFIETYSSTFSSRITNISIRFGTRAREARIEYVFQRRARVSQRYCRALIAWSPCARKGQLDVWTPRDECREVFIGYSDQFEKQRGKEAGTRDTISDRSSSVDRRGIRISRYSDRITQVSEILWTTLRRNDIVPVWRKKPRGRAELARPRYDWACAKTGTQIN